MSKNTYDESNIQILEGLEAVRKRPGMYIGSTDSRGLHHLVWEIVDNAIDEALSGYGDLIEVTICKDNSIKVQDHGRGMPTGMHASGRPTTEVILTILHAGGKFSEEGGYKTSGGLHGVGASVVNALSHWLEVTVCRDGKIFQQRFEEGGENVGKLKTIGKTKETGTLIHFLPNDQIFSTTEFNYKTISERLRESAFLLKGIKIVLKDERTGKMDEFHFENGLEAFIDYLNTNKDVLHPTISIEGQQNGLEADIALQFTSGYQETTLSFVNLVRTGDGGTHETGFKTGLTKTFNEYARKYGLLKEKDKNLEGNDVREGLSAIISVKVPEHLLQFEGQTKSKLGTPEARNIVDSIVYEKLSYFLEENKEIADKYPDFYDNVIMSVEFENGMQGVVEGAQYVQYGYDARVEILGTEGVISLGDIHEKKVITCTKNHDVKRPTMHSWTYLFKDAYVAEDTAFVRAILDDTEVKATGHDGKMAVKIVRIGNESLKEKMIKKL